MREKSLFNVKYLAPAVLSLAVRFFEFAVYKASHTDLYIKISVTTAIRLMPLFLYLRIRKIELERSTAAIENPTEAS